MEEVSNIFYEKTGMRYNPFEDFGIITYEQFKRNPFLVVGNLKEIDQTMSSKIMQVKNEIHFGSRMILIGQKGLGKSSALFFIKQRLDENNIKNFMLSQLIEGFKHFQDSMNESLVSISEEQPVFVLIDFPDSMDLGQYKKFLIFLWNVISHPNQDNIHLIFAMNQSHYDKGLNISEIFGKFQTVRFDNFSIEETRELIEVRLKKVDRECSDVFEDGVIDMICAYSKGIPRNVISACNILVNKKGKSVINTRDADRLFKEEYSTKIINDRIQDNETKKICARIIEILKNEFNSRATSKEKFLEKVQAETGHGRRSITTKIDELIKYGLINEERGGHLRINRILSLNI